ncbi:MAG TPA: outer membrane beta-barrel protein [Bacteroidota bacterium]|nr:outer membrane beta-barrel protein [Bacteroidota bacterium]
MKPRIVLFIATALVLAAAPGRAQDTVAYHLGLGMSVEPALFGQTVYFSSETPYTMGGPLYSSSPYYIYIPVNVTTRFRLEPRFGIYSFSEETTGSGLPSSSDKFDFTLTHIGLAALYVMPVHENFRMYAGPRAGINWSSYESTSTYISQYSSTQSTTKSSETDLVLSGTFGAEYAPVTEFSIGAEIDVNWVSFGNPDQSTTPAPIYAATTSSRSQSLVSTGALFFIRWFCL